MATFIKDSQINDALEQLIEGADTFLWLICPYFQLSDRTKNVLKKRKESDSLEIIVVYGKNENNREKSLSNEDLEFLMEFRNIKICYEQHLHAKFYASDNYAVVTSLNLHKYSQNTNIECGVVLDSKTVIKAITDFAMSNKSAYEESLNHFEGVIKHSNVEFLKKPIYKQGFLGVGSKYLHSEVEKNIYANAEVNDNPDQRNSLSIFPTNKYTPKHGYCIRTGIVIPFDVNRPLCNDAYKSWANFKNPDFPEKHCHLTGIASNGKTSMRNPILK